jgi:hypothetical protein
MRRESGNVLFIILIGVALFAALMYAMTHSSTGGTTISKEQAEGAVSEAVDYAITIQTTLQKMQSLTECTDAMLDFGALANYGGANASAPSDKSCHLFDPAGGGLKVLTPPAGIMLGSGFKAGYVINSGMSFVGVSGSDQATDLYLTLYNVTKGFCDAVNRRFNSSWTSPPIYTATIGEAGYPWATTFAGNTYKFTNNSALFSGKTIFCGLTNNVAPDAYYVFNYALILK